MAVGPVRSLLAAHLQATFNRNRKELGRVGALVGAVLIGGFALLALLPLGAGSAVVGWMVGGILEEPRGAYVLGGVLTLLSLGGGIVGGVLGGTRALNWESYRIFPLPFRSLFAGELVAGLGDSLSLVLALALSAFLLGTGVARPALLPLLLPLALAAILVLLLVQLLMGVLAAAVVKRIQFGLFLVGALAWATSLLGLPGTFSSGPPGPATLQGLRAFGRGLLRVLDALPATQAAFGLSDLLKGAWASALLRFAYPVAGLALLLAATAWVLAREAPGASSGRAGAGTRSADRLWGFRTPVEGLARLHWRSVITSHIGRFGFLIPLMTVILLKGPLAHAKHQGVWGLPAAFLYLGLTGSQLQFNQFGLDGHGVKALFLLPAPARQLLLGKGLGLAWYQGSQALLLALLLELTGGWPGPAMAAALLMAGCVFLAQTALGHWTSAWLPRPLPRASLKNNNMALPVVLLGVAASSGFAGIFGGAFAVLAWLAPAGLLPGMALLFGLTLLGYRALLPLAAAYLDSRREQLLSALG